MKRLLPFLFLLAVCSTSALAQQTATPDTVPDRFFIGFAISNTSYGSQYRQGQYAGGSHTPVATVHAAYWLNDRASVQLGFGYGYGRSKFESSHVTADDRLIHNSERRTIQAFSAQVTGRYTLTNPARRLRLHGFASITPIWGSLRSEISSMEGGVKTSSYQSRESGLHVFAAAGLGINLRISRRFEAYAKAPLLHHNLSANSFHRNFILNTGLNYRFKQGIHSK